MNSHFWQISFETNFGVIHGPFGTNGTPAAPMILDYFTHSVHKAGLGGRGPGHHGHGHGHHVHGHGHGGGQGTVIKYVLGCPESKLFSQKSKWLKKACSK